MDAVKVVISNDQKAVKIPTGIRMLICLLYTSDAADE